MNWDNRTVLRFLQLYEMNACIWDPQHEAHKNRQHVNDAWNNIQKALGVNCTVKELKKKKESLMSAYRHYKTKIKKSENTASSPSDIYQPTWFAFELMDRFLGTVYTCNLTINNEDTDTTSSSFAPYVGKHEAVEVMLENIETSQITDEINESNSTTSNQESSYLTPIRAEKRRQKNPLELTEAKWMAKQQRQPEISDNSDDECMIFGQLIAKKIRKLSQERRDIMMVKINQLFVDEHKQNSFRP